MSSISTGSVALELLSTAQLAAQLGLTTAALQQLRLRGQGPQFVRVGPRSIRYRRADVDAYLAERVEQPGARKAGAQ